MLEIVTSLFVLLAQQPTPTAPAAPVQPIAPSSGFQILDVIIVIAFVAGALFAVCRSSMRT